MVCSTVSEGGFGGRQVAVRVNTLGSSWGYEDLTAVAKCGATAVLLPKVESGDMVRQAISILEGAGALDELAIWCMMETPRGMLHAE